MGLARCSCLHCALYVLKAEPVTDVGVVDDVGVRVSRVPLPETREVVFREHYEAPNAVVRRWQFDVGMDPPLAFVTRGAPPGAGRHC